MNFSNFFLFLPFYYQIFFISAPPPIFLTTDNLYTTGQEEVLQD